MPMINREIEKENLKKALSNQELANIHLYNRNLNLDLFSNGVVLKSNKEMDVNMVKQVMDELLKNNDVRYLHLNDVTFDGVKLNK